MINKVDNFSVMQVYKKPPRRMSLISYLILGTGVLQRVLYRYNATETWWNAQGFCRRNHIDLATIRDPHENDFLTYGWIGLHLQNSDWRWSRGNLKANYTPWELGWSCLLLDLCSSQTAYEKGCQTSQLSL